MTKRSNRNTIAHGAYASDVVLPCESREDFEALWQGIRRQFNVSGAFEEGYAFEIAELMWRKRRVARMAQIEFQQSSLGTALEKAGKRSAGGISASLRREKNKIDKNKHRLGDALSEFTEAIGMLEAGVKARNLGKVGANLRSFVKDLEVLRSLVESVAKLDQETDEADTNKLLNVSKTRCELEARIDSMIKRKMEQLVYCKEYSRQYGVDSSPKFIEHAASASGSDPKPVNELVGSANDNDNNNNDDNNNEDNNDNNDVIDPSEYDWEHEYDEALAAKKKARND